MLKVHLGAVSWYNSDMVYLDYAATSPLLPEVIKAMHEAEENFFANASALHTPGHLAMNEIEKTRELLAEIINADPKDIIFNKIQSVILDKNRLEKLKKSVCIIDLASAPGGVDFEYSKNKGINTCWYLGVPSKDFPESAAKYIKSTMDKVLRGDKLWEKRLM